MTHVMLSRNSNGTHTLLVDGIDLSMHVINEGFRVEVAEAIDQPDRVHMVIAADTLEADLPESVITAIRCEADDA